MREAVLLTCIIQLLLWKPQFKLLKTLLNMKEIFLDHHINTTFVFDLPFTTVWVKNDLTSSKYISTSQSHWAHICNNEMFSITWDKSASQCYHCSYLLVTVIVSKDTKASLFYPRPTSPAVGHFFHSHVLWYWLKFMYSVSYLIGSYFYVSLAEGNNKCFLLLAFFSMDFEL